MSEPCAHIRDRLAGSRARVGRQTHKSAGDRGPGCPQGHRPTRPGLRCVGKIGPVDSLEDHGVGDLRADARVVVRQDRRGVA